jgi:hypothetical protein
MAGADALEHVLHAVREHQTRMASLLQSLEGLGREAADAGVDAGFLGLTLARLQSDEVELLRLASQLGAA